MGTRTCQPGGGITTTLAVLSSQTTVSLRCRWETGPLPVMAASSTVLGVVLVLVLAIVIIVIVIVIMMELVAFVVWYYILLYLNTGTSRNQFPH